MSFDNGSSITDPSQIANVFNSYFSTIGVTLQSKIHSSYLNLTKYLKNPNIHSFFISPTDSTEVYNLIASMKNGNPMDPIVYQQLFLNIF